MLQCEMNEKVGTVKASAPAIVIGALFAVTAWILFSLALVFLLSMAFEGKPYQYAAAFGVVLVIYAIIGAVALSFGISNIKSHRLSAPANSSCLKAGSDLDEIGGRANYEQSITYRTSGRARVRTATPPSPIGIRIAL